ncbi:phage/plasmid replication domain-containing protein [Pseudomonas sp. 25 E 4]|uniref:phage/plasmid replication domain-containing protein n=1 Tax=Pseudomonas sp. 25 E 4 TaxID=1844097 RepID=UPI0008125267|nr:phage/plasmid replication protein [Pseudomonas sp. 25 E 4]CRM61996.1 Phage X family protein [Pseudomonas sp. 25 E 4]
MFIDWLTISQEHDHDLPVVCGIFTLTIDANTNEVLSTRQPRFKHEASFSTSVTVHVQGRKVRVEGNPSRVGRLDNLFGFVSIEQCVSVYNALLREYGLPGFTRCTRLDIRQGESGAKSGDRIADGAKIERIDLTTNISLGEGNVLAYLRGVSSQRIGHSIGFLYPNGRTVAWTPKGNGKGGRLQYRKAYDKAFEMNQNCLPKIKRVFGEESEEYKYVQRVKNYCAQEGVVRMEQELKSEYLQREALCYWGLFDERRLAELHSEFLKIDEKLKVTAMDIVSIAEQLVAEGVCPTLRSARTTASYALEWMSGTSNLDFSKSQVKTHAAFLNRIGINIRNACDTSRFAPVFVRQCREVTKSTLAVPVWYQRPNHLQQVAA